MEITTCEQKVVSDLSDAQGELDELRARASALEVMCGGDALRRYVWAVGRRQVLRTGADLDVTAEGPDGSAMGFEEWVAKAVRPWGVPDFMSCEEFADAFEEELRCAWAARAKACGVSAQTGAQDASQALRGVPEV